MFNNDDELEKLLNLYRKLPDNRPIRDNDIILLAYHLDLSIASLKKVFENDYENL